MPSADAGHSTQTRHPVEPLVGLSRIGGPPRDFVGYGRRPPEVQWPEGAAVAVNIVVNYEEGAEYNLLDGDGFNDNWGEYSYTIEPEIRDLGMETHMEFGSRVGVWRLANIFDEYDVPVTVGASALALQRNPEVCDWLRASDHEVTGHGYRWIEPSRLTRDEERLSIRLAIEHIRDLTGQRIAGWYGRSMPSINTRELLVEEGGFLYDSDSCNDELPYFARVHSDSILVIPYSKVYNDGRYLIAPTYSTPNDFYENLRLGLDQLVEEVKRGYGGRMMSVGLHCRWSGQANRATAVRRFVEYVLEKEGAGFMRRLDIARFWHDHFGPAAR